MRSLPLLARVTLALSAGILLGSAGAGPARLAAAAALATAILAGRVRSGLAVPAAFAAVGVAMGAAAALAPDCARAVPDGARIEARGSLDAVPGGGAVAFRTTAMRRARGAWVTCEAGIRVRIPDARGRAAPEAGRPLRLRGVWWAPEPGRGGPGMLLADGIAPDAEGRGRAGVAARGRVQARIRRLFGPDAPLVEALLIARKEAVEPGVRQRFADAGLSHLLAISGLHVGLVAAGLLLLGRIVRVPERAAAVAAAAVTAGYVLFLGAPYAATRAALQALLLLAGRILQRPAHPAALLSAAALAILAADPLAVRDPGFQLSFAGVAGLLWLRRPLLDALARLPGRPLRELLAASVAATLATSPIAALHFGQVAPVGVLANLVAIPLVGLLVPALAAALAASFVSWTAAEFLAGGASALLDALAATAAAAAALPGGHLAVARHAPIRWALAAAVGAAAAARALAPERSAADRRGDGAGRQRRQALRALVASAAGVAALAVGSALAARQVRGDAVEIHAIDVGQGDALAIRSPAGRWILVDAGPRTERFDAGRQRVVPFLLDHGAGRLEAMILTHPDGDHIGGAAAVLRALEVGWVLDPGVAVGKPMYLELLETARERGARWAAARAGRVLRLDGLTLTILHPEAEMLDETAEANAFSVVFRLEYGAFAALFTGDAPAEAERALVRRHGSELGAAVLKVGHHGSRTSTSEELLEAARPGWALVSVGRRNRYGHPAPEVVDRLRRARVRVLRTDRSGTLVLRADREGRIEVGGERCSSTACYAP